jgi:hypothetical protein
VPVHRIELKDAKQWWKGKVEDFHEAALKGVFAAAQRTVQYIVTTLIPNEPRPPVDRGAFRAGWRAGKLPNGAIVQNTLPYASVIEHGARAENVKISHAMIEALTQWVMRKGLAGKAPRGKGARRAEYEVEAKNIAWAIAVSMKRRGIFNNGQGLQILARAENMIEKFVREEVRREMDRVK